MNVLSFFFHPHFVVGTVDDKTHSLLNSDCWWLVSDDDDDDDNNGGGGGAGGRIAFVLCFYSRNYV